MKRLHPDYLSSYDSLPKQIKEVSEFESHYRSGVTFESILMKQECNLCGKDITKLIRIISENSQGKPLCLRCFNDHSQKYLSYIVMDKMSFNVYAPGWTALEEVQLIQGVDKFGIDNWNAISSSLTTKTSKEIESHYYSVYYQSKLLSCPNNSTDVISQRGTDNLISLNPEKVALIEAKLKKYQNDTKIEESADAYDKDSFDTSEMLGYNQRRNEFIVEYDNDCELLISELEFDDSDSKEEYELKSRLIEMYNDRVKNRIKNREFIIERDLIDVRKLQANEKKRSKKYKEVCNKLKKYMRFLRKEEFESLVTLFCEEQDSTAMLEEHNYYKYTLI